MCGWLSCSIPESGSTIAGVSVIIVKDFVIFGDAVGTLSAISIKPSLAIGVIRWFNGVKYRSSATKWYYESSLAPEAT